MVQIATFDHDSVLERNRENRYAFFLFSLFGIIGFTTLLCVALGASLGGFGAQSLLGIVGFSFGIFLMIKLFPRFWIVVPQSMAFVTTNQLAPVGSNPNVPYGPGGHFCFPWELRAESGNITLDTLTVTFCEKVPTATSEVTVSCSVQFKFCLVGITRVIGLDFSVIEHGFVDILRESISERLTKKTALVAKDAVLELRNELSNELQVTRANELLEKFDIIVQGVQIPSIDLPQSVQKTRDSVEEVSVISRALWQMMGFPSKEAFEAERASGKITEQDINRVREQFLAANGNVKMNIHRIDATGLEKASMGSALVAGLSSNEKEI